MADLGLNALTDDQLLDLLQQACIELRERDPFVRGLAQAKIVEEAEKLKIFKEEAINAVKKVKKEYREVIQREVSQSVKDQYKAGKLKLVPAAEEAEIAVAADIKMRIALIDDAVAKLKAGTSDRFAFEVTENYVAFAMGGDNFQMTKHLAPDAVVSIGTAIRALIEK